MKWYLRLPLLLTVLWVLPANSQPTRELGVPDAVLKAELLGVTSIRELRDGRVIIADRKGRRLLISDIGFSTAQQVGREGEGPGEYRSLSRLHALEGDSTLVEDRGGRRWLLLDGGKLVTTISADPRDGYWRTLIGTGPDGQIAEVRGFRFGRPSAGPVTRVATYAESLVVLSGHRGRSDVDTLLKIGGRFLGMWSAKKDTGSGRVVDFYYGNPLAVEDQAVLMGDGTLAVAYRSPYRVECRGRDPGNVRSWSLPGERTAVDETIKRAALRRTYPRGPQFSSGEIGNWPPFAPPFPNDALQLGPAPYLLIERLDFRQDRLRRYDVVSCLSGMLYQIHMSESRRVVGAGRATIYVATEVEEGFEVIERYRWSFAGLGIPRPK